MLNWTNFDENALMCSGVSTYLPESTTEAEFRSHTSAVLDRLAVDYDNISYSLKGGKKISNFGWGVMWNFLKEISSTLCIFTVCCRVYWPKQNIPRLLSIFLSKVYIEESDSVEKIILQQRPLGVTSQSAPADQPKWPHLPVLTGY